MEPTLYAKYAFPSRYLVETIKRVWEHLESVSDEISYWRSLIFHTLRVQKSAICLQERIRNPVAMKENSPEFFWYT
jgi:hypothetical protein